MSDAAPLATLEVRWFFGRDDARYEPIRRWFPTARLDAHSASTRSVTWAERTDVYLLIPGSVDMGVKWREGQLQIKGRIASLGAQRFGDRPYGDGHYGVVERWVKWSYAELPTAYQTLFEDDDTDIVTVPVRKRRALHQVRLDPCTGDATEVHAGADPACGLGFEFTELIVGGQAYGTLAFEAYPDDEATRPLFPEVVARFLRGLDEVQLTVAESKSYPAWLTRLDGEGLDSGSGPA